MIGRWGKPPPEPRPAAPPASGHGAAPGPGPEHADRASAPWPTDLAFDRAARTLSIAFDDGARFEIPFELLRVESPSAEVQGHGPSGKRLVRGKERVDILSAEPVGAYAVRLVFDDGHSTGIYTWPTLRRFGEDGAGMLAAYRAQAGL